MKAIAKTTGAKAPARTRASSRNPARSRVSTAPAGVKLQNILVPTDFSPASMMALDFAASLAAGRGGRVVLLHVIEPVVVSPEFSAYAVLNDPDKLAAAARDQLQKIAPQHGLDAGTLERTIVRFGTPFHEITRAAELMRADLVVIATHGYTGLKHVLLGSTAERVVRHARCPVLVVPARR
jgi:nucleotide-binding universal stress UspA family protein